ncbi:MAG: N-acetyl-D-Glu racemase DgcA [Granulosicoccaceae bacterium]
MIKLDVKAEQFKLAEVFTISRGSRTAADVITVTLTRGNHKGRGESVPYARYGETMQSVTDQIMSISDALAGDITTIELQVLLPGGAARNAVDCALWDLLAKESGKAVWQLAGLTEPGSVVSAYTLSLAEPDAMRASAAKHANKPLLKIKLGGADDMPRLLAVREGAPDSQLIVDANEAWSADDYARLAPVMLDLGVSLVEQPLAAGDDEALLTLDRPLPICADEACHGVDSLASLKGKYDFINIKLDKAGGLTEAIALQNAAIKAGFRIMVGCMVGSSLAMAPAVLLAQRAEVIDLDGPLLLSEDRDQAIQFEGAVMSPASAALWG